MADRWVVLVEASAADVPVAEIDPFDVERLLQTLDPGAEGGALHSPDRYALQLTSTGSNPAEALVGILARWADAVRQLELPAWQIVRAEVFTPEELERELKKPLYELIPIPEPGRVPTQSGEDDLSRQLLCQAFSDPLTGLLNRAAFENRLEVSLARTNAKGSAAVLWLDLDAFGGFNDRFGGTTGDEVLISIAERLGAMLRTDDDLARVGGDKYAVLLDNTTEESAAVVVQRILDVVRSPLTIQGRELNVSASAGVALSRRGEDAHTVVGNATAALALAKEAGAGRHVFCRSTISHHAQTRARPADSPQDRLSHLLLMQEAAIAANEADTLEEAARVVMRQICSHVGCVIGHLWVSPDDVSTALSPSVWHVADANHYAGFQEVSDELAVAAGEGLPGRALATGRPVWIADLAADLTGPRRGRSLEAGLESGFAFPVLVGREVVAVLEFLLRTPTEPTSTFMDVLAGIGTQLGRVVERQQAAAEARCSEAQLRASEARLRDALALARLGSWHFDLRTPKSSWSEQMYSLYGLDPGEPAPDLEAALAGVHPIDQARAKAALARLIESGEKTSEEVRIVRTDGQVRWHRVDGSVKRDENGIVVAIHGTSQDITERKIGEQALRERQNQLSEAQRVARLGSWELDVSTGRVTCSDEMFRLWGWEPGCQISFDGFLATVQTEDRRRLLAEETRLRRTGEPFCVDFRASVADGRQRWFRGRRQVVHDQDGRPTKLVGTVQDITEERQAEDAARNARELYQQIVETAHEGILTVDTESVTTFANPRIAQILGYSVEELTDMPASAFVEEQALASLIGHRQRRRGVTEHFETTLRAKDGGLVPVLIAASPLFDQDGQPGGTLAMVTDVAALREVEEPQCWLPTSPRRGSPWTGRESRVPPGSKPRSVRFR